MTICICPAEYKKKKYSTSGCYSCWTCETCGKFGGCDNRALTLHAPFSIIPTIGMLPPFPADLLVGRNYQWYLLRNKLVEKAGRCAICSNIQELEAHHKKPFHLYPELELIEDNVVVLCQRCHFVFGHLGDWKSWNPYIDIDVEMWYYKFCNRKYERCVDGCS